MDTETVDTDSSETEDTGSDLFDPEADLIQSLENEFAESSEDELSTETESEDDTDDSEPDQDMFVVKVDGEEVEVTRDELLAGYSRQADYTRKTQELAQERKELAQLTQLAEALNTDPKSTLEELARAFGVEMGTVDPVEETFFDDDDPLAKEIRELREWKQEVERDRMRQQQASQEAALQREIDQVKAQFEVPDLDEEALLRFAVDNEIHNLNAAYELMSAREAKATQPHTEKLDAKRTAPPVQGGSSRKGARKGAGKIGNIADALAATMQEFNG